MRGLSYEMVAAQTRPFRGIGPPGKDRARTFCVREAARADCRRALPTGRRARIPGGLLMTASSAIPLRKRTSTPALCRRESLFSGSEPIS